MRPVCLPLVLACASLACATAPTPVPPPPPSSAPVDAPDPDASLREEVRGLAAAVENRLRAEAGLYWKTWTAGEGEDAAATEAPEVYTPEALKKVARLRERTADALERRKLERLELLLASQLAARQAEEVSRKIASLRATATMAAGGVEEPFRDLELLLAREGHPGRRRELLQASRKVLGELNPLLEERERRIAKAIAAQGYPSELHFAERLRELALRDLTPLAEVVLSRTEAAYVEQMEALARKELGMTLKDMRRADVPRLFRTGEVDSFFPKDQVLPRLSRTLQAMGLPLAERPGLQFDDEPRARKIPRALAVAVEVPGDVRLSIKPRDGLLAYSQALAEAARALRWTGTNPAPFELTQLGPDPLGDAFARLLEDLPGERSYAQAFGLTGEKLEEHVRRRALWRLFRLRTRAARALREAERSKGNGGAEAYREVMSRAYGFPVEGDADRFRIDRGELLGAADELRATLVAGHLKSALVALAGPEWWSDPRSGKRLAELFAAPLAMPELLQALGGSELTVSP